VPTGGNASASGMRQVELEITFGAAPRAGASGDQRFDVGVLVETGGGARSRIGVSGTLRPAAGGRYVSVTQARHRRAPPRRHLLSWHGAEGGLRVRRARAHGGAEGGRRAQATLYADHSRAGGATIVLDQRGDIPLPANGISVDGLSLRVFVDRSLIEARAARPKRPGGFLALCGWLIRWR